MVITVLEAQVKSENWDKLKKAYQERAANLPPEILETFLVQDTKDPQNWQIITVWHSMKDLQVMRDSGVKPTGVVIFNEAGADPDLSILEVSASIK